MNQRFIIIFILLTANLICIETAGRHRRMCGSRLALKIFEICNSVASSYESKPYGDKFASIVTNCCVNACRDEDIIEYCISSQEASDFQELSSLDYE